MIWFIIGFGVGLFVAVTYPGFALAANMKARDVWNRIFGPKDPPPPVPPT